MLSRPYAVAGQKIKEIVNTMREFLSDLSAPDFFAEQSSTVPFNCQGTFGEGGGTVASVDGFGGTVSPGLADVGVPSGLSSEVYSPNVALDCLHL